MKKIRVLHIIDTAGPGGAEKVLYDIIKNLDSSKFESFLIIPDKGWLYAQLKDENITIDIINGKGSYNISYIIKLIWYVYRNEIDVIHAHLMGVSLYCIFVSLFTGIPLVSTIHGYVDLPKRKTKLKIQLISAFAKRIVFVSEHLRAYFLETTDINKKKTEIIYNGINSQMYLESPCDDLRAEFGLSNDDILVGSVGNITPPKGYDILLTAASIVCKSNQHTKFLIAGEKRGVLYKNLEDLRRDLRLDDKVFFVGYRTRIASFLKGLDIFVLPSKTEGFSLSTVEAMAVGLPVIVTKSGGPEEIIDDLNDGLLVDANDPNALAEKILLLLDDIVFKKRISSAARKSIKNKFTIEQMINKYERLYNQFGQC